MGPSEEDLAIDDDEVDISTTTLVGSIIGGVVTVGAAVALLVGCCIYQKSRRERSGYQPVEVPHISKCHELAIHLIQKPVIMAEEKSVCNILGKHKFHNKLGEI